MHFRMPSDSPPTYAPLTSSLKFSAQPINFAAMRDVTSRTTTLCRSTVYDKNSVTITELKGSKSLWFAKKHES